MRKTEQTQRSAVQTISRLRDLSQDDRLRKLNLMSLQQRRDRGNMTVISKLMMGKDYLDTTDLLVWDTREMREREKKKYF